VLLLLLCVFADGGRPDLLPEGGGAIGLGGVEGEEEVDHAAHGCGLRHLQEVGERAEGVQRPHQILLFVQVRKICIKAISDKNGGAQTFFFVRATIRR
jgi:hypothetical protein